MGAKHLRNIPLRRSHAYTRTRNSFAYKPISAIEGSWASIERVSDHVAFFDWPSGQYNQSTTKDTTMVELSVWKYVLCLFSDSIVVLLRPAFLKTDNVWRWVGRGDLDTNFC